MTNPEWLPDLYPFHGKYDEYIEELYKIFVKTLKSGDLFFDNLPIKIRWNPSIDNKDRDFWHIITEGDNPNEERLHDFRRCERISWIRAIIENYTDPVVKIWKKAKTTGKGPVLRTYLLLEESNFIIVLENQKTCVFLITAFYIEHNNYKRRLLKEYEEYINEGKT